jgi:hypothetical protein
MNAFLPLHSTPGDLRIRDLNCPSQTVTSLKIVGLYLGEKLTTQQFGTFLVIIIEWEKDQWKSCRDLFLILHRPVLA